MERILEEIERCQDNNCKFAAISLALMIPDVCAAFDKKGESYGKDYIKWCNDWITWPEIAGEVVYALRCSLFHSLDGDLDKQVKYKEFLEKQKDEIEHFYRFFFPHEDTEEPVIYQKTSDNKIQNTTCISLLTNGIVQAYKNFAKANPDFSHEYINLWLEG